MGLGRIGWDGMGWGRSSGTPDSDPDPNPDLALGVSTTVGSLSLHHLCLIAPFYASIQSPISPDWTHSELTPTPFLPLSLPVLYFTVL